MSRVIAVVASLAVLASSKTLRGKTVSQQDPGTSDEYEYGDREMAVNQGDSSDFSVHQFFTKNDGRQGTPTNSDDSGDTEMARSKALAADDHFNSEETPDDSDSFVQGGKKSVNSLVKVAGRLKQDPDMSADDNEDSTLAAAHSHSSGTMTHELSATEADDIETQDADAAVSKNQDDSSTQEFPPPPAEGGDDEQVTAASGGSGNMKSVDNEITEHQDISPDLSPHELVDTEGDAHKGTPMNVVDSDTMEYDGEHDDAETLATQGKPTETVTQDRERTTEGDSTQAVDSGDAATVQLKEDVGSDNEDTSDDSSSSA